MEIKGNIGEEAYVKVTIRGIEISEVGISYYVNHKSEDDLIVVPLKDMVFKNQTTKKEMPKDEPQKVSEKTLKTPDNRFQHSQWLRETIEASGLTQADFVRRLNAWLKDQHTKSKYADIKSYYAPDISGYMRGNTYMSEYKIRAIKDFSEDTFTEPEPPKKKWTKATVASTMAKLEKLKKEGGI